MAELGKKFVQILMVNLDYQQLDKIDEMIRPISIWSSE